MAFPTNWKLLQPSSMEVLYHTSPSSLCTNESTLDLQCYSSSQDSMSVSTNNTSLECFSNGLLQDYGQVHDRLPFGGCSSLGEWIALEAQSQLMNSNNIPERSTNIDWLDQNYNLYEGKGLQESMINSSSSIPSTTLSPSPYIDQFTNYSIGNQVLPICIDDFSLTLSNPLHNKPLVIEPKPSALHLLEQELARHSDVSDQKPSMMEPKPLDLGLIEQELAMYDSIGDQKPPAIEPKPLDLSLIEQELAMYNNLKSLAQGDHHMKATNSLYCEGANSSMYRSNILASMSIMKKDVIEEKDNVVEKREERENVRNETREAERQRRTGGGRRGSKGSCGDEREALLTREKKCNSEDGILVEVKREEEEAASREQATRKRAREFEGEEGVIHVRARRGQATDSHSLAERVRRERINQRMKLLQDLVPSCTKVLGKAAVLEEIINYVKSLQQQIEFLSMRLANTNYQRRFHI